MSTITSACASTLACVLLLCASAAPCEAQSPAEQEAQDNLIRLVAASTCTTTGVFVVYGAVLNLDRQNELQQDVDIKKQFVLLDAYLDHNEVGLRGALAVGGGAAMDDVANLLGHRGRLGAGERATLRAHRADLLAALDARAPGSLTSAASIHAIFVAALDATRAPEVAR